MRDINCDIRNVAQVEELLYFHRGRVVTLSNGLLKE